jgi:hypothetical protein
MMMVMSRYVAGSGDACVSLGYTEELQCASCDLLEKALGHLDEGMHSHTPNACCSLSVPMYLVAELVHECRECCTSEAHAFLKVA